VGVKWLSRLLTAKPVVARKTKAFILPYRRSRSTTDGDMSCTRQPVRTVSDQVGECWTVTRQRDVSQSIDRCRTYSVITARSALGPPHCVTQLMWDRPVCYESAARYLLLLLLRAAGHISVLINTSQVAITANTYHSFIHLLYFHEQTTIRTKEQVKKCIDVINVFTFFIPADHVFAFLTFF